MKWMCCNCVLSYAQWYRIVEFLYMQIFVRLHAGYQYSRGQKIEAKREIMCALTFIAEQYENSIKVKRVLIAQPLHRLEDDYIVNCGVMSPHRNGDVQKVNRSICDFSTFHAIRIPRAAVGPCIWWILHYRRYDDKSVASSIPSEGKWRKHPIPAF